MRLSDFDYHLPKDFIAQTPLAERDRSKLMVLDRQRESIAHHVFSDLPALLGGDSVLVLNESRVLPARLIFTLGKGRAEILLIKRLDDSAEAWECMVRPGPKFRPGVQATMNADCAFHVKGVTPEGLRVIQFACDDFAAYLRTHGQAPTPPYIKKTPADPERYQTVYSKTEGSAAAPTAGLHFTPRLLADLQAKGIAAETVTLHVGPGTFAPVKTENIEDHRLHSEWFSLGDDVAARLNAAKTAGKKIIAVGTTSVRVLESCADAGGKLHPRSGETDIFIYPGYRWRFVDRLITNFHVPKSSLLMLVSAFAGREFILRAYEEAKTKNYRFFSFGDAMLIL